MLVLAPRGEPGPDRAAMVNVNIRGRPLPLLRWRPRLPVHNAMLSVGGQKGVSGGPVGGQ
eukprot:9490649-Pyramimonas_sp.AAC.2